MSKTSVLVVDDDESFRTYAALMLGGRGYAVEALESGNQLMARLSSGELPSVILLDVLLPDGDGIEVIGKMRTMGIQIPVIMLSGVGHVRTVVEAMKLGASDFLMKPFEYSALETAINDSLTRPQALETAPPDADE